MDVIELLQNEHRQLESLLDRLLGASTPQRRSRLLQRVALKLRGNVDLEEAVFYPAFRDACRGPADRLMFIEALEAHCVAAEVRLAAVEALRPDDPAFSQAVYSLVRAVAKHHEREQAQVFARARELMSERERSELGLQARGFHHQRGPARRHAA